MSVDPEKDEPTNQPTFETQFFSIPIPSLPMGNCTTTCSIAPRRIHQIHLNPKYNV
jgi:hypothetical protein